jgi:anti-sigma regulatory factor (Ser/Thr protein kinase)
MDGLTLVGEVRKKFPQVPVVLITGAGSEDVASEALRVGAASYVPKSVLVRDLPHVVDRVLGLSGQDRIHPRALQCLVTSVLQFQLPSDDQIIRPVVNNLQQHLRRLMICDDAGILQVGVALDEALSNAVIHGNLQVDSGIREQGADGPMLYAQQIRERRGQSPYRERQVRITARLSPREAVILIADQGPGFDHRKAPDPTDPSQLEKASGRGIFLMRNFMDEVRYNERGNEVTLIKRRSASAEDEA